MVVTLPEFARKISFTILERQASCTTAGQVTLTVPTSIRHRVEALLTRSKSRTHSYRARSYVLLRVSKHAMRFRCKVS
eukprot:6205623-Pleurochrysis_carterae.AAC.1